MIKKKVTTDIFLLQNGLEAYAVSTDVNIMASIRFSMYTDCGLTGREVTLMIAKMSILIRQILMIMFNATFTIFGILIIIAIGCL